MIQDNPYLRSPKVVFVHMTWYPGIGSHGHYYGKMTVGGNMDHQSHNLVRRLTAKEARELNKLEKDGLFYRANPFRYKAGNETERFENEKECRNAAIGHYKKLSPGAIYLISGNAYIQSPQEILEGPGKDELNKLWENYSEYAHVHRSRGIKDIHSHLDTVADQWTATFIRSYENA